MMVRVGYWVVVSVVVAFAAIPVAYSAAHIFDDAYRASLFGNLAATIIGIIVGIPIALELNRHEVAAETGRAAASRENEEDQRRRKVLGLLRTELVYNRDQLAARQPSQEKPKRQVLLPGLKDELWHAFSDGGELQWIQDLDLLDTVATAYHKVRTVIYLEERFFEATHFPGMQVHQE